MKAATYCRFSSANQKESSIADQFRNCSQFAERQGWTITQQFEDRAISGSTAIGRPGYLSLMAAAKAREFDALIVDDFSRLSRDTEETARMAKRLKFWGVRVIGVSDGIDSDSKSYRMTVGFAGIKNELFNADLAEKIKRGMIGKALDNYHLGGRTYGYKLTPIRDHSKHDTYGEPLKIGVKLAPDPEQVKIVRRIFEMYDPDGDAMSPRAIADKLNELRVASPGANWNRVTRRCNAWVNSSITSILDNPIYIGVSIWNKSRFETDPDTGKVKRRPNPESEWIRREQPKLKMIDRAVWDRCQSRRRALKEKNREVQSVQGPQARYAPPHKYLFSSLLVCGVCDSTYIIKDSKPPARYGCGGHHAGGKHLCGNTLKVQRELVEQKLLAGIADELFSDEAIAIFRRELVRTMAERKRKARPEAEAARKRLADLEPRVANMVEAIKDGAYSAALKADLAASEEEAERLRSLLQVDTRQIDKVADFLPRAVDKYRALVRNLPAALGRDVARARAQLRQLIGQVRLVPEHGHLVAEIKGNYAGLFKLAAVGIGGDIWCGRGRGI